VEESEIEENLGQLDVPAGEDGVAEGPLDDEESIQLSEAQSDLSAPPSSQSEAESASDSRGPDAADQEEGDEEDYSDSFFDSWLREK
jgi:hypothetical protein